MTVIGGTCRHSLSFPMQHLVISFEHEIQDLIPWSQFIQRVKLMLASSKKGDFVGDDMAIDGGDCEAVFRGSDAKVLLELLRPELELLPFLRKASTRIELVYGELDSPVATESASLKI